MQPKRLRQVLLAAAFLCSCGTKPNIEPACDYWPTGDFSSRAYKLVHDTEGNYAIGYDPWERWDNDNYLFIEKDGFISKYGKSTQNEITLFKDSCLAKGMLKKYLENMEEYNQRHKNDKVYPKFKPVQ